MIISSVKVTLRPENRLEFFQTISQLIAPIQAARGCRAFRFYVDIADENTSVLISEWESESDFDQHLHSNDSAILRGAINVLSVRSDEFRGVSLRHRVETHSTHSIRVA